MVAASKWTRASSAEASIVREPHPSRALWAPTTADGKSLLDAAGIEAMQICSTVPPDCARQLQSLLFSGAAHPWQTKGDGDTALHLAVFSGNEQVISLRDWGRDLLTLLNREDECEHLCSLSASCCMLELPAMHATSKDKLHFIWQFWHGHPQLCYK